MREHKYRAWYCGRYEHNPVVDFRKMEALDIYHDWIYNGEDEVETLVIDRYKIDALEEWTGLRDKNGREIYESDIIRIDGGAETKLFGVVEMKDGCWGFVAPWNDNPFVELKYYIDCPTIDISLCNFEVTGNIHENPELLNANP